MTYDQNQSTIDVDNMPRPEFVKLSTENLTMALGRIRGVSQEDAAEDISEFYTAILSGFLGKHHLPEDGRACVLLSRMLPGSCGVGLTTSCFSKIHTYYSGALSDADPATSLVNCHNSRMIMEHFVYGDKRMRNPLEDGLVSIWTYDFEEILQAFCEEYGIEYQSDSYCRSFIKAINKLAREKWGSTFAL